MKVIFIPMADYNSSSTRLRCYLIANTLKELGISTDIYSGKRYYSLLHMDELRKYDVVYIQKTRRELVLNISLRLLSTKTIYDLDDSLFNILTSTMMRMASAVVVGSHFLMDYAKKYSRNVYLVPTAINTDIFVPRARKTGQDKAVIGWCGTGEQYLKDLSLLIKPLERVGEDHDIVFRIIGAKGSKNIRRVFSKLKNVEVDIIDWVDPSEIVHEIAKFDIGIMPLIDNYWSRGKCALKALEYMAMGIPTIVSAVGENNFVINDGFSGFLAKSTEDWIVKINKLLEDDKLARRIGQNGRKTVEERYSIEKVSEKLADVLRAVATVS